MTVVLTKKAARFTASLIILLCWCMKHLSVQQQITEPWGHACVICLRFVLPWALERASYLNTVFTPSRPRRGVCLFLLLSLSHSHVDFAEGFKITWM